MFLFACAKSRPASQLAGPMAGQRASGGQTKAGIKWPLKWNMQQVADCLVGRPDHRSIVSLRCCCGRLFSLIEKCLGAWRRKQASERAAHEEAARGSRSWPIMKQYTITGGRFKSGRLARLLHLSISSSIALHLAAGRRRGARLLRFAMAFSGRQPSWLAADVKWTPAAGQFAAFGQFGGNCCEKQSERVRE